MSNRFCVTVVASAAVVSVGFCSDLRPRTGQANNLPCRATIRKAPSMDESRAAHTATSLANGDVLVFGGFTEEEDTLAGAQLFHQESESWGQIAQPRIRRQSHTSTRLLDGRVLIAGGLGEDREYLDSALLYHPVSKTFTETGRMTTARSNHVAVMLEDGRVLLIGGTGTGWTFLASAEIFDPQTGAFTKTGDMGEPREGHTAVILKDGNVLVSGGHRGRGNGIIISGTAEIYDFASGRFKSTGKMTLRRHKHDSLTLQDGRVLVLGGSDERDSRGVYKSVEFYDPVKSEFHIGKPMLAGRYKHWGTSFVQTDGRVLLTGGATRAEIYDPESGETEFVETEFPLAGQFSAAARLPNKRVLIAGGYGSGHGPVSRAWIFEPGACGRSQ